MGKKIEKLYYEFIEKIIKSLINFNHNCYTWGAKNRYAILRWKDSIMLSLDASITIATTIFLGIIGFYLKLFKKLWFWILFLDSLIFSYYMIKTMFKELRR